MTQVCYCTREQVQQALDQADSVRNNRRIDDAIRAASRDVGGWTHRQFYPTMDTRYPDPRRRVRGTMLDLNSVVYELAGSPSSVLLDGDSAIEGTDFYLDPEEGPHTSIRLISTSSLAWPFNERTIALTGPFGASMATMSAGALAASLNSSATTLSLSNSALAGVGDLLQIGSERMPIIEKEYLDTGATVSGTVAADRGGTTIGVSNGALIHVGETVLIGAERMFVEAVAGNNLIVKRAQSASTLAAHAALDVVYAPRLATVERGAAGTTASSHSNGDALLRNLPPAIVSELALALALNNSEQAKSAYARQIGSGDNLRESGGRGVAQILSDCVTAVGRIRSGATR